MGHCCTMKRIILVSDRFCITYHDHVRRKVLPVHGDTSSRRCLFAKLFDYGICPSIEKKVNRIMPPVCADDPACAAMNFYARSLVMQRRFATGILESKKLQKQEWMAHHLARYASSLHEQQLLCGGSSWGMDWYMRHAELQVYRQTSKGSVRDNLLASNTNM